MMCDYQSILCISCSLFIMPILKRNERSKCQDSASLMKSNKQKNRSGKLKISNELKNSFKGPYRLSLPILRWGSVTYGTYLICSCML